MTDHPDASRLFGTLEPPSERRLLKAGRLSAILEDGNLRTISLDGVEAIRAVNFLARDSSWGTYRAKITNFNLYEDGDGFEVSYDGLCDGEGRFAYTMTITGSASGRIEMKTEGEALTDFPTNRLGFVVLHPAEAGGMPLTVRHTDGRVEKTAFPELISPDQPVFDIAELTHAPAPGLTCSVTMDGDAFEMEDQRNWSDASFKTYIRPLAKPRPYLMPKGAKDAQRVEVVISGAAKAGASSTGGARIAIGNAIGRMPRIAYFVDETRDIAAAVKAAPALPKASDLVVRFDIARGDGPPLLKEAADLAKALGAALSVEAVFDTTDPEQEAKAVVEAIRASGVSVEALLMAMRREFKSQPSNTVPPGERTRDGILAAVRAMGWKKPLGDGSPSHFTEFNRNRPGGTEDFVFFGPSAVVHSADDVSVMETLGAYPSILASAHAIAPEKPLWLGPCTLGMRHNPYGAAVADNPRKERVPMARNDPRHGALFGAAFMAGVAAQAVRGDVERLILAAPVGAFGLVEADGAARPVLAIFAAMAEATSHEALEVETGSPSVLALAYRAGGTVHMIVANITSEPVAVTLPAGATKVGLVGVEGAREGDARADAPLELGAYRTALVTVG